MSNSNFNSFMFKLLKLGIILFCVFLPILLLIFSAISYNMKIMKKNIFDLPRWTLEYSINGEEKRLLDNLKKKALYEAINVLNTASAREREVSGSGEEEKVKFEFFNVEGKKRNITVYINEENGNVDYYYSENGKIFSRQVFVASDNISKLMETINLLKKK